MLKRRGLVRTTGRVILLLVTFALVLWTYAVVVDSDVYGRLSETKRLQPAVSQRQPSVEPTVRLVIHRLLADENAVEVSIMFIADGAVASDPWWRGKSGLQVALYDCSSVEPDLLAHLLPVTVEPLFPGHGGSVTQSERFTLPALPSLSGYPFDDVRVYFTTRLRGSDGWGFPHSVEVTKTVPGRLLIVNTDPLNAQATLKRSGVEQTLVLILGGVFFLLSGALAAALHASAETMRGWQEILAFAGYVVGAGGFRDLLGLSRSSGVSAFEVVVFGLPLALLVVVVTRLFIRDRKGESLSPAAGPADQTDNGQEAEHAASKDPTTASGGKPL